MTYKNIKMNENDLINSFSKEELKELLKIQIEKENYEGAKMVKSALEQYDECGSFILDFEIIDDIDIDIDDSYLDDI